MSDNETFPKGINPDDLDPTTRTAFEKLHAWGQQSEEEKKKDIEEFEQKQAEQGIFYDERDGVDDVTWDEYQKRFDAFHDEQNKLFGNAPENPPEN